MKTHQIYNSVERLGELLRVDSRKIGAAYGLLPIQVEALHFLAMTNRFSDTPMAVTEYLGQTKGTVSQTLKVLESKGLLEKCADEKDKRITHLRVTSNGLALLSSCVPSPDFKQACEFLDDEQQQTIAQSMQMLITAMLQANGMKSFGMCQTCRFHQITPEGDYFCNLVKQPLAADERTLICREHQPPQ